MYTYTYIDRGAHVLHTNLFVLLLILFIHRHLYVVTVFIQAYSVSQFK